MITFEDPQLFLKWNNFQSTISINCKDILKFFIHFREELRGISRGKDAKDIDWASVASNALVEITEKPEPIKISLSDVIKRVKKPTKSVIIKNNNNGASDKNSKLLVFFISFF